MHELYFKLQKGNIENAQLHTDSESVGKMLTLNMNFSEFDEFNQFVAAWDLDFRQLTRGRLNANLTQCVRNDYSLGRVRSDQKTYQQGVSVPDMRSFAFLSAKAPDVDWCGGTFSADTVAIFPTDGDFRCMSHPGFFVYTVSFTEDELEAAARRLSAPYACMDLKSHDEIRQVDRHGVDVLCQMIDRYLGKICVPGITRSTSGQSQKISGERLAEQLVGILSGTEAPGNQPSRSRLTASSNPTLRYVEEHLGDGLTVNDLAIVAGVSRRTLESRFREQLQVSPKAFINEQRMLLVRRDLRLRSGTESISDVANRWGFWHMGQFAKDYRLRFGELPSQTTQL